MNYLGVDEKGLAVSGVWSADSNIPEGQKLVQIEGEATFGWTWNGISWEDPRTYRELRRLKFPSVGDQLDSLFKAGLFPLEMAALIQAVKDTYPKP
jgi:hypothetical protein